MATVLTAAWGSTNVGAVFQGDLAENNGQVLGVVGGVLALVTPAGGITAISGTAPITVETSGSERTIGIGGLTTVGAANRLLGSNGSGWEYNAIAEPLRLTGSAGSKTFSLAGLSTVGSAGQLVGSDGTNYAYVTTIGTGNVVRENGSAMGNLSAIGSGFTVRTSNGMIVGSTSAGAGAGLINIRSGTGQGEIVFTHDGENNMWTMGVDIGFAGLRNFGLYSYDLGYSPFVLDHTTGIAIIKGVDTETLSVTEGATIGGAGSPVFLGVDPIGYDYVMQITGGSAGSAVLGFWGTAAVTRQDVPAFSRTAFSNPFTDYTAFNSELSDFANAFSQMNRALGGVSGYGLVNLT